MTRVQPTDYANLYEVQLGGNIVYTNEKAEFVLAGNLVDAKTKRDVTTERIEEISKVDFSTLPLAQAVKLVKGNGARKMAVFEDPNCGYCKKLHKELTTLDNVTVYTFLFPILAPDSVTKANNVWCAKDQATVWTDWMNKGIEPPAATCETPIEKILPWARNWLSRVRQPSSLKAAAASTVMYRRPGSIRNWIASDLSPPALAGRPRVG